MDRSFGWPLTTLHELGRRSCGSSPRAAFTSPVSSDSGPAWRMSSCDWCRASTHLEATDEGLCRTADQGDHRTVANRPAPGDGRHLRALWARVAGASQI